MRYFVLHMSALLCMYGNAACAVVERGRAPPHRIAAFAGKFRVQVVNKFRVQAETAHALASV